MIIMTLKHHLCLLAALALPVCALATPVEDVKALVEAGKLADAYAAGRQSRDSFGDPTFDFYFGIAAVESGHAGEGVLALERYLLQFPDNTSARLQLARGYFILGEDARARDEFEALRKLSPPADVAATIDRFLDVIRLRESRYSVTQSMYVELGIGADSNVNGGVASPNIVLPNLGPVLIAQGGTKQRDGFTTLAAGGYISYPVAPGIALFGSGQLDFKYNNKTENHLYNSENYNLNGGASWLNEKHLFRLGASESQLHMGNNSYLTTHAGQGEWQYQVDEQQAFTLGAQAGRLTYASPNQPRNADFVGLAAGYRKLFSHPLQPVLNVSINAGEQNSLDNRNDLVPRTSGGRIGVSFTPAAEWGVSLGYTILNSDYKEADALLGVKRSDRYEAFDVAASYLYSRNLSFRGEITTARNRSNIELYSFPRDLYALKVRYEFK